MPPTIRACHNINYHANASGDDYYSCSNAYGDSPSAVKVFNTKWLNAVNYARKLNGRDIIALVQYNMNLEFANAVAYLHKILGLSDMDLSEMDLAVDEDTTNGDYKKEDADMPDEIYQKSLKKDLGIYRCCERTQDISWFKEGIVPTVSLDKFGVRNDWHRHRAAIPIRHYRTGEIAAISYRSLLPDMEREIFGIPKYQATKGYSKSFDIYGLYENKDSVKRLDIWLCLKVKNP